MLLKISPRHRLCQDDAPMGLADKEATAPAAPAVEARRLSLVFETADGKVEALSNVDLQIEAGDFVSFIGPSGCGKTTLLRIIADLERPTEGTVLVNGVTPEQARLNRHYGYIFQAPALYPWRTIERNIMLPLEVMGIAREEPGKPWFSSPTRSRRRFFYRGGSW